MIGWLATHIGFNRACPVGFILTIVIVVVIVVVGVVLVVVA